MIVNKRLETLSDKARRGEPINLIEALEVIEYQEQLSDKAFKVFTKPINNDYQWALSLFASGGMIWHSFVPLLIIKVLFFVSIGKINM